MTERKHKKEMTRYAESEDGTKVWCRCNTSSNWGLVSPVNWYANYYYVVDDCHAINRMLQIDEPSTQFQIQGSESTWSDTRPSWDVENNYRVKPTPKTEKRWQMLQNTPDSTTCLTNYYYSQKRIDKEFTSKDGWYKSENFIEVTLESSTKT